MGDCEAATPGCISLRHRLVVEQPLGVLMLHGEAHQGGADGRHQDTAADDEEGLGQAADALEQEARRDPADIAARTDDPGDPAEAFVDALEPLQPRLYSISPSPKTEPGKLTLTVDAVRYVIGKRKRLGVASTYLGDRAVPGDRLRVYIQKAHNFALPPDPKTPVIMVGSGTGIAPFRAFLHERKAIEAPGPNWLFFGHQRQATDFFYRDELQAMQASGLLTRLSLAWSRDSGQKFYVQDRMREVGAALWQWLDKGAHFFICGDAKRMAKDVEMSRARWSTSRPSTRQEPRGCGGFRRFAEEGGALPGGRVLNTKPNDEPVHPLSHPSDDEADVHRIFVALIKLALVEKPSETAAWRADALAAQRRIAEDRGEVGTSRLDDLWSMAVKVAESDPAVRREETANPVLPTMSRLSLDDLRTGPFELDSTMQSIRNASSFG